MKCNLFEWFLGLANHFRPHPTVHPRHMGPHGGWSVKPEFSYGNVHGAQMCHSVQVNVYYYNMMNLDVEFEH